MYISLFGKGSISSGKASEYLGVSRIAFLEQAAAHGINMFSDDADTIEQVLDIEL